MSESKNKFDAKVLLLILGGILIIVSQTIKFVTHGSDQMGPFSMPTTSEDTTTKTVVLVLGLILAGIGGILFAIKKQNN